MAQLLHTGRLVLTPEDPYFAPGDTQPILDGLREIGFIDQPWSGHAHRYLLGDAFIELVTFMGCSPHIRLEPGEREDHPFCHLVVEGPVPHPRMRLGRNTSPPRCAACRKRLGEWRAILDTWSRQPAGWLAHCPHCGHAQDPATYDFRQSAGSGRLFLSIENIFPQEAVPSPNLISHLEAITAPHPWRYFYQQD